MMGLVRYRTVFSQEVVDAPSLDVIKDRLDGALSNLS